jgi:hypothetical protein
VPAATAKTLTQDIVHLPNPLGSRHALNMAGAWRGLTVPANRIGRATSRGATRFNRSV